MSEWEMLLQNRILITAVTGWFVAQVLKTLIHMMMTKTFDPERLVGSGGMPSSHSSTVCAMATASLRSYNNNNNNNNKLLVLL